MALISSFFDGIGGFLFVLLPFLFVLTVVVFIHELGHFLVARWCGVNVRAFSIGFGPEIAGFYDRHGTRWRIAWIPLGGYVKFMDDENAASAGPSARLEEMTPEERAGAFHAKPLWQRAAIVAAGPIANFLLAIVIFALMFSLIGVRSTAPRVDEVVPNSPAAVAGFMPGDVILEIDGEPVESFNDVLRTVSTSPGRELTFKVDRGGAILNLRATPERQEIQDSLGGTIVRGIIGIRRVTTPDSMELRKAGPLEALWLGVRETNFIITSTLSYIGDVIIGRQSADQLGGPIRIAEVSGQVAKIGPEALLNLIAVISVSIGLINLFPIPLLDGGHLLFYAIEALRRKPLSEKTQEIGFRIGLAVVLMLMVFATWNDIPIVRRWIIGNG
ncbi:MAG: RIP metalloprotease RseP [Proteobacteria bacterium]|mgnify:CR=1 FL=1|jgi:regulator of sigma E protease|nr:MAG: RIP metalloprotease RseP [Pseudomonadota bacterium]